MKEDQIRGQFRVDLVDDAMAPDMPTGARIEFLALPEGKRPRFGTHVLLIDGGNEFHFREYVQASASQGGWLGKASGRGFRDISPAEDGARVLAVMTARHVPVAGDLFGDDT